ncbi:MAG: amidohydrolase [Candidatus Cloacimonetes bacterium]|nr:amidohydrolase [Candidatus Cloacimonadota bacterium]
MENKRKFDARTIRRELHELAELSGKETKTTSYIQERLIELGCREIISDLGGKSLIAVYDSGKAGSNVMLRAELDALPIQEENEFSYISKTPEVSHKCGHDGHMAILLAVADWLNANISKLQGRVYLLFQAAEETAEGARAVIQEKRFQELKPDYIFALHNLPGFARHSLILRKGVFAAASMGMKFRFTGRTSHAGHPENGISPLDAMQSLVTGLGTLSQRISGFDEPSLVTIIHLKLGEEAFGTSPGKGVVMATLRSADDEHLQLMARSAEELAEGFAEIYGLKIAVERVEEFAATVNNAEAYDHLERAALKSGLEMIMPEKLFSWSEDFSYYGREYKTAFWGLGSGKAQPQLHNPDYDFPDELIESGKEIFIRLLEEIL